MTLGLCHVTGKYNFEMTLTFLERLCVVDLIIFKCSVLTSRASLSISTKESSHSRK